MTITLVTSVGTKFLQKLSKVSILPTLPTLQKASQCSFGRDVDNTDKTTKFYKNVRATMANSTDLNVTSYINTSHHIGVPQINFNLPMQYFTVSVSFLTVLLGLNCKKKIGNAF